MQGWIKLHRSLLEKSIWNDSTPEQKTILITLLMMANHQDVEWEWKGEKYKAESGQFITSLDSIAQKSGSGISIRNVRTALKRFEKYGFLTNESTNKNRLITIVNWGFYQDSEVEGDKEVDKQVTSKRQATDKQVTTNKNVKNEKNVINNTSSRKCKIYDQEDSCYRLALELFKGIRENEPNFKEPNLQKWADDMRLMLERDNRTEKQIAYLINWCQKDSFWKSNILSPAKLRKQYDQLVIKIKSDNEKARQEQRPRKVLTLERPSHLPEPGPVSAETEQKIDEALEQLSY